MFHEYPKAVYLPNLAEPRLAESVEHEAAILGRPFEVNDTLAANYLYGATASAAVERVALNAAQMQATPEPAPDVAEFSPIADTEFMPKRRRRGRPPKSRG